MWASSPSRTRERVRWLVDERENRWAERVARKPGIGVARRPHSHVDRSSICTGSPATDEALEGHRSRNICPTFS